MSISICNQRIMKGKEEQNTIEQKMFRWRFQYLVVLKNRLIVGNNSVAFRKVEIGESKESEGEWKFIWIE